MARSLPWLLLLLVVFSMNASPARAQYFFLDVNDDGVCFNGIGGNGHEPFCFTREPDSLHGKEGFGFTFCKTAQKPYDEVVCAVLLAAIQQGRDFGAVSRREA